LNEAFPKLYKTINMFNKLLKLKENILGFEKQAKNLEKVV